MKSGIHPEYHDAKVTCACGNSFTVGSTVKEIRVEICANCHPFYTGKQKLIDTAKRVEKFQAKTSKASALPSRSKTAKKAALKAKRSTKAVATPEEKPEKKSASKN